MQTKIYWFAWVFVFGYLSARAQDCHVALRGRVLEAETHVPLAYATVYIPEVSRGTVTDEQGNYVIPDLCERHSYAVEVRHVECAHTTRIVELTENQSVDFELQHNNVLAEVVIREQAVAPHPVQAEVAVSGDALRNAQGVNLGETLKRLPGVTTLSSGNTIAKPVIQGLHSNRIAIVTNGSVLEGQQWGADHAPEIDPFTAGKITVVKGAAAVRYGVGALGGAVILEPPPLRAEPGVEGWAHLGIVSNGRGGVGAGAVDWRLPGGKLGMRMQGTLKRSGNLRSPDYWLGNTGAAEGNGSLMLDWKYSRWQHTLTASTFNQQIGILRSAHIGNLSDLQRAIESDTPLNNRNLFTYKIDRPYQRVRHQAMSFKTTYHIDAVWKFNAQYDFQYDHRREYDVVRTASERPQIDFRLWTNNLNLALEHLPIRHWQGAIGAQAIHQLNYVGKGGYIPDYNTLGASAWVLERWRRYPDPWEFEMGLRYDYRQTDASTRGNLLNVDTLVHYGNLSATGGLAYHLGEYATVTLNSGLAWRPPHVYELFARGVHFGAGAYEKGDPNLVPEKAWNSQLTFQWSKGRALVAVSVFHNRIRDFLFLRPGGDFVLTVRGAFPAYYYTQSDAVFTGFDGNLSVPLVAGFSLEARTSVLRAYRYVTDSTETQPQRSWLPLIPADRLQYGLRWATPEQGPDKNSPSYYVQCMAQTTARQIRYPEAGLLAPPPAGYTVLSLEAGFSRKLGKIPLDFGLSMQNIANTRYREYLNYFRYYADEIGFSLALNVKIYFKP